MDDLRGIGFINVATRKLIKFLSVGFIFRQGWQWSWPESTLLIPRRTTVLRVTMFEVSIKGFSSLGPTYLLSSCVLKCSCTVQMISLSARKSVSQHEMQGELFHLLGHLVASLKVKEREYKKDRTQGTVLKEARCGNTQLKIWSQVHVQIVNSLIDFALQKWCILKKVQHLHPGKTFMTYLNRRKSCWTTSPLSVFSASTLWVLRHPRVD